MKNYLLSFLLVFLVLGCKTVKQTHKSRENKQIVRVDSVFVEHTQTIKDTVYLTVPTIITEKSECDSLCQREVERLMQSFTFSKHNGSHSHA